ncbi:MAG: hypothetical protein ACRDBP_11105 [Luteolibacter sp.]
MVHPAFQRGLHGGLDFWAGVTVEGVELEAEGGFLGIGVGGLPTDGIVGAGDGLVFAVPISERAVESVVGAGAGANTDTIGSVGSFDVIRSA